MRFGAVLPNFIAALFLVKMLSLQLAVPLVSIRPRCSARNSLPLAAAAASGAALRGSTMMVPQLTEC